MASAEEFRCNEGEWESQLIRSLPEHGVRVPFPADSCTFPELLPKIDWEGIPCDASQLRYSGSDHFLQWESDVSQPTKSSFPWNLCDGSQQCPNNALFSTPNSTCHHELFKTWNIVGPRLSRGSQDAGQRCNGGVGIAKKSCAWFLWFSFCSFFFFLCIKIYWSSDRVKTVKSYKTDHCIFYCWAHIWWRQ